MKLATYVSLCKHQVISQWGHCGVNPSFLNFALMLCKYVSDDECARRRSRLLLWHRGKNREEETATTVQLLIGNSQS